MDKLATFMDYEKISDDIMYLGDNVVLRFSTQLGYKNMDGTKKLFHTEYKYASNKYTDNKYLISLRRHFEYYLSIENIRQNENLDKEFIRITISDIYLVRLIFRQVSSWFFSIEYKNLYKANGKRLEIVKKITNATVPLRDKYLELEPIVISYENEDIKGVRLYLSSRNNFTDISAEKFTGLVYIIESINMYEASLLQINYLQRPNFGTNLMEFNNNEIPLDLNMNNNECIESNTSRKIPIKTKKSFFDSMIDLEN